MRHVQFASNPDLEFYVVQENDGVRVMLRQVSRLREWRYKPIMFWFLSYQEYNWNQSDENGHLIRRVTAMEAALAYMDYIANLTPDKLPIFAWKAKPPQAVAPRTETLSDQRVAKMIEGKNVNLAFGVEYKRGEGGERVAVSTDLLRQPPRHEAAAVTKKPVTVEWNTPTLSKG